MGHLSFIICKHFKKNELLRIRKKFDAILQRLVPLLFNKPSPLPKNSSVQSIECRGSGNLSSNVISQYGTPNPGSMACIASSKFFKYSR
uniref:Uncharacterized protein n=1 Tax=Romanomermis culicivorax TaxID=13658 RepID=A0A915JYY1_ROMCU